MNAGRQTGKHEKRGTQRNAMEKQEELTSIKGI
jgi:hypothetical protein